MVVYDLELGVFEKKTSFSASSATLFGGYKEKYFVIKSKNRRDHNNILRTRSHVQFNEMIFEEEVPQFPFYWSNDHFGNMTKR